MSKSGRRGWINSDLRPGICSQTKDNRHSLCLSPKRKDVVMMQCRVVPPARPSAQPAHGNSYESLSLAPLRCELNAKNERIKDQS